MKVLWEKRKLILDLAKADFKKRFVGSYLGIFWIFVQPVVTIIIYYYIFQLGFKSNPQADVPYVVWLLPGIIPWFFFNEAVMNGTVSMLNYQHLVKKMVFPIKIIPAIRIAASLFIHFIFVGVMLVVILLLGVRPSIWWLQFIYYMVCNILLITGIVYLLASLNVFIKDIAQLVNIFLQVGFWLAPIMYDTTIMPKGFQFLISLNPFVYIVEGGRECFFDQVGFWQKPGQTIYFWVITLVLLFLGSKIFDKFEKHFVDVL